MINFLFTVIGVLLFGFSLFAYSYFMYKKDYDKCYLAICQENHRLLNENYHLTGLLASYKIMLEEARHKSQVAKDPNDIMHIQH